MFALPNECAYGADIEWIHHFGTPTVDDSFGMALDAAGSVYVTGGTDGNLGGPSAGNYDVFLRKVSSTGSAEWKRQIGSAGQEFGNAVTVDGLGNVFVTGHTYGNLAAINTNGSEVFLSKFDTSGAHQWTKQRGSSHSHSFAVAADQAGNAYIAGRTQGSFEGPNAGFDDAYVSKYDSNGNVQWTRQFGTSLSDAAHGVSVDASGNVYVVGSTEGVLGDASLGGPDAFLAKYDSAGVRQWIRQFGAISREDGFCVSADLLGNVFVAGRADVNFPINGSQGGSAFVSRFDSDGASHWTTHFGVFNEVRAIATDNLGNVVVAGDNFGGGSETFAALLDVNGAMVWSGGFGTDMPDAGTGVAIDGSGKLYLSGITYGDLGGPSLGYADGFIMKFTPSVPEPCSWAIAVTAVVAISQKRRRRDAQRTRNAE